MQKVIRKVIGVVVVALFLMGTAYAGPATSYTGSLSAPAASGLDGTGIWVTDPVSPVSIEWTVTDNQDGTWHYKYCISVPHAVEDDAASVVTTDDDDDECKGAVGHFILETSLDFNPDLIENETADYDFGLWEPDDGNSNPGLPGNIYGIKFEGPGDDDDDDDDDDDNDNDSQIVLSDDDDDECEDYCVEFDHPNGPVWGDAYAKNGRSGNIDDDSAELIITGGGSDKIFNAFWNEGFTDEDPTDDADDDSLEFHLLVPDTVHDPGVGEPGNPVPEPSAVALIALGSLGLVVRRRRSQVIVQEKKRTVKRSDRDSEERSMKGITRRLCSVALAVICAAVASAAPTSFETDEPSPDAVARQEQARCERSTVLSAGTGMIDPLLALMCARGDDAAVREGDVAESSPTVLSALEQLTLDLIDYDQLMRDGNVTTDIIDIRAFDVVLDEPAAHDASESNVEAMLDLYRTFDDLTLRASSANNDGSSDLLPGACRVQAEIPTPPTDSYAFTPQDQDGDVDPLTGDKISAALPAADDSLWDIAMVQEPAPEEGTAPVQPVTAMFFLGGGGVSLFATRRRWQWDTSK
jgi:PEP-CTERM motif-containing protein